MPTVMETQTTETTAVPETQPPETTEPSITETEPQETTAPTVSETEPLETTMPTVPETQPPETTAPTVPEMVPVETAESISPETEATEPVIILPESSGTTYASIADALATPAGTGNITIRGTVVYAEGTQAVLQDDTGGIRLSFSQVPGLHLGDALEVTGLRSGGFVVTDYVYEGVSTLPAVESTLLDAGENLRVKISGATLGNGTLSQSGFSMTLIATLPDGLGAGSRVDAWGVILDGRFYADTLTAAAEAEGTVTRPASDWKLYFGNLHAHTDLSDGLGSVTEAFQYASNVEGLDFFAVTDHSNSFDNAESGAIDVDGTLISAEWAEGKAAAAAVTDGDFVGIFGYEMTWTEDLALGHINTFGTPGWQTRTQPGFDTLEGYYAALAAVPGSISQFNHPGPAYGNFYFFSRYDPDYDEVMHLLEVGGEGTVTVYELYTRALDEGWHVAPSNNQNNHNGSWGDASGARTVVLAQALTEEALFDAIRSYRVYATEDADLSVRYTLNGRIMGSTLSPTDRLLAEVALEDPTDEAIGTVEVIADKGEVVSTQWAAERTAQLYFQLPASYSYYYLRITQPDGDIAVTAPVWLDHYEDIGIGSFWSDITDPQEGQTVTLTLEVVNQEVVDYQLEKVELSIDGTVIGSVTDPETVNAYDSRSFTFPYLCQQPGEIRITATVTGYVEGALRTDSQLLILRCQSTETVPLTPIAQVRTNTQGEVYQIKGFVTAGNDNPYNTFSNTIYLQDDSGGIAVVGHWDQEIRVGDPLLVSGVLLAKNGNVVLEMTEYTVTEDITTRYVPETISNTLAKNYSLRGGQLLQVEGQVASLTTTIDEKGISRFTIQDARGVLMTVVIEENIRSAAHGTNELASTVKKGRTVRAMGLLHMDEYGQPVLRVRNCDEVVYVPSRADPSNPRTGDVFARIWYYLNELLP